MKIVNGYVCECSDEVRLAKRGIDPANPHSDPLKQKELDAQRGVLDPQALEETRPGDLDPERRGAVSFGGALAGETRGDGEAPAVRQLIDLLV